MEDEFFIKYLEYKLKYLQLKSQLVGGIVGIPDRRVEKNRAAVLNLFKKCYSDKYNDEIIKNTCYNSIHNNDDYKKLLKALEPKNNSKCIDSARKKANICINAREKKCYSDKYDDKTIENTCYFSISKNDDYKKLLKALEPENNSKCIDSARKKANICINAREKRNYNISKLREKRKELPPSTLPQPSPHSSGNLATQLNNTPNTQNKGKGFTII